MFCADWGTVNAGVPSGHRAAALSLLLVERIELRIDACQCVIHDLPSLSKRVIRGDPFT